MKVSRNNIYWQFNPSFIKQTGASVVCGRTIYSHSSLPPPPCGGHLLGPTLLWDGVSLVTQHLSQVSQCGWFGHPGMNSTPRLWTYGIATGWRILSQYFSALRWPPMLTSLFFQWPSDCNHQSYYPVNSAVSVAQINKVHFRKESGHSAEKWASTTRRHTCLAAHMNQLLMDEMQPEWLTKCQTVLIPKDP